MIKRMSEETSLDEFCEVLDLVIDFSLEYGADTVADYKDTERLVEKIMVDGVGYMYSNKAGKIVGVIGGLSYPNVFNNKLIMLGELFWYVSKDYRGGLAGGKLLNAFLKEAEEKELNVVLSTLDSTPDIDASLMKKGFQLKEKSWILWA